MNWKVWLPGAAVCVALVGITLFFKHHEVTFERLGDAKAALDARGYHCIADTASGQISCGFAISRQAINWSDVGTLCKAGPMGREWQGKVWVTISPDSWRLGSLPDQAGVRVWGAVVAFGDEQLLCELDAMLRPTL